MSTAHLLGTTAYGQDMFAQVVWGTRNVLIIAFVAGLATTVIAVLIGVAAAYLGGALGRRAQPAHRRAAGHPAVPAADRHRRLRCTAAAPLVLIVVITVTSWSYTARQLRSQALSLRSRDFLEAARVRGERRLYIIVVEIIPTMTSLLVACFLTNALYAVLFASSLQFIGLGDPNTVSWGTMLYWAQNNAALQTGQPLWAIAPGACIAALGRGVRPAQLRVRRDRQPGPAAGCGGTVSSARLTPIPSRRAAAGRPRPCSRSATCRSPT